MSCLYNKFEYGEGKRRAHGSMLKKLIPVLILSLTFLPFNALAIPSGSNNHIKEVKLDHIFGTTNATGGANFGFTNTVSSTENALLIVFFTQAKTNSPSCTYNSDNTLAMKLASTFSSGTTSGVSNGYCWLLNPAKGNTTFNLAYSPNTNLQSLYAVSLNNVDPANPFDTDAGPSLGNGTSMSDTITNGATSTNALILDHMTEYASVATLTVSSTQTMGSSTPNANFPVTADISTVNTTTTAVQTLNWGWDGVSGPRVHLLVSIRRNPRQIIGAGMTRPNFVK